MPSNSFFGYTEPPSTPVAAMDSRGSQEFQGELSSARQQQQRNQSSVVMYNVSSSSANKLQAPQFQSTIFWFNMSLCLLIIAAIGIKGIMKYRLVPVYSGLCFLGGLFLIAAYAYSTFPALTRLNMKSIPWRGRSVGGVVRHSRKRKMT